MSKATTKTIIGSLVKAGFGFFSESSLHYSVCVCIPIHGSKLIAKNDNTCNNNMGKIEVSMLSGGSSRMAIQKKSYNTILQKVYLIRNICMYVYL